MADDELSPEQDEVDLRDLREQLKGKKQVEARAAELERELAFARAGVPDTPLAQQLARGYEGESDPAAVRAYFDDLGVDLSTGTTQPPAAGPSDTELADQRAVAQVGSAGDAGGEVRFEDAISSAKNPDEVMALIANAPEGATTYVGGRNRRIGPPTID